MRAPTPFLLALLVAALLPPAARAQPSFDCARAGTAVERAICASPALSLQDREMGAAFLSIGGLPGVADSQRAWRAERDRRCGTAMTKATGAEREACLGRLYAERLAALRTAGTAAPAGPVAPGWEGAWRPATPGLSGDLTLRRRADGRWDARLSTARDRPPNPTCEGDWLAEPMSDGALVGRAEGGTGPTILLRRDGAGLTVSATDPASFCGVNGAFTGSWRR